MDVAVGPAGAQPHQVAVLAARRMAVTVEGAIVEPCSAIVPSTSRKAMRVMVLRGSATDRPVGARAAPAVDCHRTGRRCPDPARTQRRRTTGTTPAELRDVAGAGAVASGSSCVVSGAVPVPSAARRGGRRRRAAGAPSLAAGGRRYPGTHDRSDPRARDQAPAGASRGGPGRHRHPRDQAPPGAAQDRRVAAGQGRDRPPAPAVRQPQARQAARAPRRPHRRGAASPR